MSNGRYQATYRGSDGRERQQTFNTKALAERWEREGRTDAGRGIDIAPVLGKVTCGSWSETWLRAQAHLAPKTYDRYAGIVTTHILPRWAERPLASITHAEVQGWVSEMTTQLAPASVRKTHRVLSLMLDLAVRDGRLARNVAKNMSLPRVTRAKHRYLSHRQVAELTEQMDDRDALIVLVLAYTGLRWGELAALRVSDVDPLRRRLSVDRSVTEISGHLIWGLPKDHERRSVPFPAFLAEPLAKQCIGRTDSDLLFATTAGTPIRVGNFRRDRFDPAAVRAGLKGLHPHELRHTAASLAVSAGASIKVVQGMLGHRNASMTLDVYADLFPDDLDEVSEALDAARTKALADFPRTSAQVVSLAKSR
jgi:integrase